MVQQVRACAARSDNLFDPEFDLMEGENQFLQVLPTSIICYDTHAPMQT